MSAAKNLVGSKVVLVPDAKPGAHVGLQVHWRLAGVVDKQTFDDAIGDVLPPNLMPWDSADGKYLHRAVDTVRGSKSHTLLRRMGQGGFSLVHEKKALLDLELVKDDDDHAYNITLNASLVRDKQGNQTVKITPENHPQAAAVRIEFERQRTLYHAGVDLSQWLSTKVIPAVNGVSGRERGGFYFIPAGEDVVRFQEIVKAVHAGSVFDAGGRLVAGIKVYCIPAVFSENMADAVIDSLTEEAEELVEAMHHHLEEEKLGLRAWGTQRKSILSMESKLDKFSRLLGVGFDGLVEKLNDVQRSIGYLEAQLASEKDE